MDNNNPILIYQNPEGGLELPIHFAQDNIWLTQAQIGTLFDKARTTVTDHIKQIYLDAELEEVATRRDFRQVRNEGGREVERGVIYYNLDLILSVGYRVNSKKAVKFRQWANSVLKQYLVAGAALNEQRLATQGQLQLQHIQQTINIIIQKTKLSLSNSEQSQFLELLELYTVSLQTLNQFDHNELNLAPKQNPEFTLDYHDCLDIIAQTKTNLVLIQEASELFGVENDNKFHSLIGAINQTFDNQELYSTVEEKAAHLLYFTIKDHPFTDGNKRSASILFVWFLSRNNPNVQSRINNQALIALTILIAQSSPGDKDIMIQLIMKIIQL